MTNQDFLNFKQKLTAKGFLFEPTSNTTNDGWDTSEDFKPTINENGETISDFLKSEGFEQKETFDLKKDTKRRWIVHEKNGVTITHRDLLERPKSTWTFSLNN